MNYKRAKETLLDIWQSYKAMSLFGKIISAPFVLIIAATWSFCDLTFTKPD
jgi:hypothetical protein